MATLLIFITLCKLIELIRFTFWYIKSNQVKKINLGLPKVMNIILSFLLVLEIALGCGIIGLYGILLKTDITI